MNYCIKCGSSNIDFNVPDGDNRQRHSCKKCGYIHYINPRIIAGCIIQKEGKVLLAKRAIEPRYGKWNLPAGFLEQNEDVIMGAAREALEETGHEVRISHLQTIYSVPHVSQVFMLFVADIVVKRFENPSETLEMKLYSEKEIPWDDIAFSSNTFAIKKFFENNNTSKKVYIGQKEY
jgi:ADP-ribose pyrophosphatase YjhB (NUDIX family)